MSDSEFTSHSSARLLTRCSNLKVPTIQDEAGASTKAPVVVEEWSAEGSPNYISPKDGEEAVASSSTGANSMEEEVGVDLAEVHSAAN